MSAFTAKVIVATAMCLAIAVACVVTHSALPLVALIIVAIVIE